jgi:hypothetical protein
MSASDQSAGAARKKMNLAAMMHATISRIVVR